MDFLLSTQMESPVKGWTETDMAAHYVDISIEEFDSFIDEYWWGFKREDIPGTHEVCYSWYSNDNRLRILIYSSIPKSKGHSRKKGSDAIRVVVMRFDKERERYYPIATMRRVHRVEKWKENLNTRVKEASILVHETRCPYCGDILVLRQGMHGDFYSCYSWPKTGCQGKAKA